MWFARIQRIFTLTWAFHSQFVYLRQAGCYPIGSVCITQSPVLFPPLYLFLLLQKLLPASVPFSLQWLQHFSPSQVRLCISLRCPSLLQLSSLSFLTPSFSLPPCHSHRALHSNRTIPLPSSAVSDHTVYMAFSFIQFHTSQLVYQRQGPQKSAVPFCYSPPSLPPSFFLFLPILPFSCIYPSSSFAVAITAKLTSPVFDVISFLFLYRLETHSAECHSLHDGYAALFLSQWNNNCPWLNMFEKSCD